MSSNMPYKIRSFTIWMSVTTFVLDVYFLGSLCLSEAPVGVWRVMDQEGEFPMTQSNSEKRPGSPLISSSRPLWKRRHLEDNRSTTETNIHLSESLQRPQGGGDTFTLTRLMTFV